MPLTMSDVRTWRERAQQIRKIAASYSSREAIDGMLDAARMYEQLADDIERRLASDGKGTLP